MAKRLSDEVRDYLASIGKQGGKIGGKAKVSKGGVSKLSPQERSAAMSKIAKKRWKKKAAKDRSTESRSIPAVR